MALWKDITELNPKQSWSLIKYFLVKLWGGVIIWALRTQYMATWKYGQKQNNMMSSKRVCTRHHISNWKYTWTKGRRQAPRPRERRKIWLSLKGPPSDCDFIFFYLSLKQAHNGGCTWHIFFPGYRGSKLQ